MATMQIEEHDGVAGGGKLPFLGKPLRVQTPLTYSTHAESAAFGASTRLVRFSLAAAAHVAVFVSGDTGFVTTSYARFPEGVWELEARPSGYLSVVAAA